MGPARANSGLEPRAGSEAPGAQGHALLNSALEQRRAEQCSAAGGGRGVPLIQC